MKTGVVYLTIKLELNQDIDTDKVKDFVDGLYYEVKDEGGLIQNTDVTYQLHHCHP